MRSSPVLAGQDALVAVLSPVPTLPQVELNEALTISLRKPQCVASFTWDAIHRQARCDRGPGSVEDDGAQIVGEHYLEYMQQYYTALTQVSAPTIDDADALNVRTHEAYRLEWPADEGDELRLPIVPA
ncbi:hypothetical protein K4A87_11290 [Xanthomonas fragariae]|nr:hypothetical protein [Xanthomonas fragariae]UKR51436.1 hypothetical protein K4A87_11290 [Xanthomonas fragariae]